jgi:hypothetical protein
MAVTVAHIKKVVANAYGLDPSDLAGSSRKQRETKPRHVAIALAKELTDCSTTMIGRAFGGRNHTTVINSLRVAAERWPVEVAKLRQDVLCDAPEPEPTSPSPPLVLVAPALPVVAPLPPVVALPPRFVPRKVRPDRLIQPVHIRRCVTGALLGDPGHESPRVARGETSMGID